MPASRLTLSAKITLTLAGAALVTAVVALALGLSFESTDAVCEPAGDDVAFVLGLLAVVAAPVAVLAGVVIAAVRRTRRAVYDCLLGLGISVVTVVVGIVALGASLDLCFTF